jgi:hypothetical protein
VAAVLSNQEVLLLHFLISPQLVVVVVERMVQPTLAMRLMVQIREQKAEVLLVVRAEEMALRLMLALGEA